MVVHASNPAGGVQGHLQLHKLKVRLGCVSLFTNFFTAYLQINSKVKHVAEEVWLLFGCRSGLLRDLCIQRSVPEGPRTSTLYL